MTIALILHGVDKNRLMYTSTINQQYNEKKMLKGTVNIYNNLQHRPI